MNNTEATDSAYPLTSEEAPYFEAQNGLSKREYFAALAMQGFCASQGAWEERYPHQIARMSVEYADLLIEALNTAVEGLE